MPDLSREDFTLLHNALFEKFKEECATKKLPFPATKKHQYGYEDEVPSLQASILAATGKSDGVETKNSLYQNWRNVVEKKTAEMASIGPKQLEAYFAYLGVDSLEDIKERQLESIPAIEYKGYYYSYALHKVCECRISLRETGDSLSATMTGFHKNINNAPAYSGSGQKKSNYLFINLKAIRDGWEDEFKIIGHTGFNPTLSDIQFIRCIFTGVSSYNYPTAGEMVLINHEKIEEKNYEKIVTRYLFMKRNRIRVKTEENRDIVANLKVKRSYVKDIEHMVGVYSVLNFDGRKNLVVSRFEIKDDYSATFNTVVFGAHENNQVCLMEISSVQNRRLCISTHPEYGTGILSYVMLNITRFDDILSDGAFCSVGNTNSPMPVSGPIVLLKRIGLKTESLKIETIKDPKENIKRHADKDLLMAYERLVNNYRRAKPDGI
jgi:hypothetical protein